MTAPSDLARQLVEHPRWTWQPGMGVHFWGRPSVVSGTYREHGIPFNDTDSPDPLLMVECAQLGTLHAQPSSRCVLDLDHPATKGWLLHTLREATGERGTTVARVGGTTGSSRWCVAPEPRIVRDTEGEALAAALLAVWGDQ